MFSTSFFQTAACSASFGFAWQRKGISRKFTSFREHFSQNENSEMRAAHPRKETQIPRWIALDRNDLGGFFLQSREQAVHETLSPWCHFVLAFVFVSHSLLFTLSEDLHQNTAGVRLR